MSEDLYSGTGWLSSVSTLVITDLTGLLDQDSFRGENDIIDGMPGEVGNPLVRAAYDFPVPFRLSGATLPALYANVASLRGLFATSLATYTRRLTKATTPFYVDTTCNGQYLGLTWTRAGEEDLAALDIGGVLNFRNLDGEWT